MPQILSKPIAGERTRLLVFLWAISCLPACLPRRDKPESFGLTLVELKVSSENLSRLATTVAAKRPVAMQVTINGREASGRVHYAGKSTIDDYKKNFDLYFNDGFRFRGRSTYRLSAMGTDRSAVKTLIGFAVYEAAGLVTPHAEPAAVYLNGSYLGLYTLVENVDEEFFAVRRKDLRSLYKAQLGLATFDKDMASTIKSAFTIKHRPKSAVDLQHLIELVNTPHTLAREEQVRKLLSYESLYQYQMASFYLNNWDSMDNNFFFYRVSAEEGLQYVPWDLDHLFENIQGEKRAFHAKDDFFGRHKLLHYAFQNKENRRSYLAKFKTFFKNTLPPQTFLNDTDKVFAKIKDAFESDRALMAEGADSFDDQKKRLKEAIVDWHAKVAAGLSVAEDRL